MAHRSYDGYGTDGENVRKGGRGRRAAASERAFGPYLFVGRVFDLTAYATPTPTAPRDFAASGPVKEHDGLLGRLRSHMIAAILLHQGINDQATVEAAQNDRTQRNRRLPFLNHQSFAFSTCHGIPSC